MKKMQYPPGLIRYTTENQLNGYSTRFLRPRVVVYALLLLSLVIALLVAINLRVPLELDIIRDRNVLFRETQDGRVANVYTLKATQYGPTGSHLSAQRARHREYRLVCRPAPHQGRTG